MKWNNLVAWRYFISKKKDKLTNSATKLSIFSTIITTASIIFVFSVIRGFESEFLNNNLKEEGHIIITNKNKAFDPKKIIEKIPKHIKTNEVIEKIGIIMINNAQKHITIKSHKTNKVIIGKNLASYLKLATKEKVVILFYENNIPNIIELTIDDIKQLSTNELNDSGILIPIELAEKKFNLKNKVNKIICHIKNPNDAKTEAANLKKSLPNKTIQTWHEKNIFLLNLTQMQQNIFLLIIMIILMLCIFMTILSFTSLINSKHKEISLLITLGATKWQIIIIFIKTGLLTTITGSCLGSCLGMLISKNINQILFFSEQILKYLLNYEILIPKIPIILNKYDIITSVSLIISLTFITLLYNAYKAASINVLENI